MQKLLWLADLAGSDADAFVISAFEDHALRGHNLNVCSSYIDSCFQMLVAIFDNGSVLFLAC